MKLYELPKGESIIVRAADDGREIAVTFHHIDGAYSYCTDVHGNVYHLSASTPLKPYSKGTGWEIAQSNDSSSSL